MSPQTAWKSTGQDPASGLVSLKSHSSTFSLVNFPIMHVSQKVKKSDFFQDLISHLILLRGSFFDPKTAEIIPRIPVQGRAAPEIAINAVFMLVPGGGVEPPRA